MGGWGGDGCEGMGEGRAGWGGVGGRGGIIGEGWKVDDGGEWKETEARIESRGDGAEREGN